MTGRLADPAMSLATDPRADPRMVAALAAYGLDGLSEPLELASDTPLEEILAICLASEEGFMGLFEVIGSSHPPVPGVTRETVTIDGPAGDPLKFFIHRPESATGPLPAMVHIHGGGMAILHAASPLYHHMRDLLASAGMLVVGVEFRNAAGALGPHAFPAGLDDCVAAVRWTLDGAADLGAGRLVLAGESGGGNLSLATALRANREGWIDQIAGVYGMCPYIAGPSIYRDPPEELGSLEENDRYFISRDLLMPLATAYDPEGAYETDPLCWPLHASDDDLVGLPPHAISVNELDPLRDEGLAYLRRLWAAGVQATGRVVPGTCHGGDLIFSAAFPDVTASTLSDVAAFVYRVTA